MKKLSVLLVLVALNASAGERYLGTVAGTAGPTAKDNSNTAATFTIPAHALLSVQCDAAAYVGTDMASASLTSGNGVLVSINTLFPTAVGSDKVTISSQRSAIISVLGVAGVVNCKVFERTGRE